MQSFRHRVRPLVVLALAIPLGGCVKEISSEERLERESPSAHSAPAPTKEELSKIDCLPGEDLLQARNASRPETDRVQDYATLYTALVKKVKAFEEALTRNPDLQYQDGSQRIAAARETCLQQSADLRVEFDRYVRELVDVPTVQEVKGGKTQTVARIDFDALRDAIQILDPEDKELLLARLGAAEQRLEAGPNPPVRSRSKKRGK